MVKFDPSLHYRSLEELNAGLLLPRQEDCEQCDGERPKCSDVTCSDGEVCSFTIPSCTSCARTICIEDDSPRQESSSSDGPNTGAIAGGVVGGIVVIAVVTYLVWRFCIKAKRQPVTQDPFAEDLSQRAHREKDSDARTDKRSSVHTVHSIASTVLTRASNIIQIAYIPGVTNRATPNSPGLLVPPVPPIPMHASASGSPMNSPSYEDQHFFTPGDLRDSTYSGLSRGSERDSYARTSYHPRSSIAPSIASTIYGKNAVVVAPAQTGMRAKAAMVSVKSTGSGGSGEDNIPAVPSIDYEKFDASKPRDSTFSVGSTFLNNANTATATQARAQVIRVGSAKHVKQVSVGSPKSDASSSGPSTPVTGTVSSLTANNSPASDQGPFSDPPGPAGPHQSTTSLSAVIEEATKRAARGPDRKSKRQSSAIPERGTSPFSDEHATRE